jgi:hypothetical protein
MSDTITTATSYYQAFNKKDIVEIEKYLHQNVLFITPLGTVQGKENLVETIKQFFNFFNALTIRTVLGSENQAMVAYDVEFPEPIGMVRSAALMDFKEGLIARIELFYDARSFPKR